MQLTNTPWNLRLSNAASIADDLVKAIAAKTEHWVSPKLRETIEAIPFSVVEARTKGLNYTNVQTLNEQQDFAFPNWHSRALRSALRQEWLKSDAKFVYDYCACIFSTLSFTTFSRNDRNKLSCSLVVTWNNFLFPAKGGKSQSANYLDIIKSAPIEYPRIEKAEIQRRAALVLGYASEILEKIQEAIRQNATEVNVFEAPVQIYGKAADDALADAQTLCELLGFKAEVTEKAYYRPPQPNGRRFVNEYVRVTLQEARIS